MKVIIISLCFVALITGCATTKIENKIIITGKFTWDEWQKKAGWEHYTADDYMPGEFLAEQINDISVAQDMRYLLFAGSWCGDSKSEVPKIYKLFETAGVPLVKIDLYGVDRDKREPTGIAGQNKIEKVPTLIILKGGKEAGRIVEYPQKSWEEDIFKILISE